MIFTAGEIAARVRGTVEGDPSVQLRGVAGLAEAGEGDLSFLANARYERLVGATKASAVVVGPDWKGAAPCTLIRARSADAAFADAAAMIVPPDPRPEPGIHGSAVVAPDAVLGRDVTIGPQCVVGAGASIGAGTVLTALCFVGARAVIGRDCLLHPLSSVRERCRLGDRVILHNGAVIGSDGFGYVREPSGWRKIPQVGIVEVGDDVEIGANTTVDRARFGKTVIGNGVKLDNLVQVAHNVRIGDHTAMAAQVGISGSASVGAKVQVGGQAGVVGHVHVGDGAVLAAKAGATKDIPPGSFVSGFPAIPHRDDMRIHAMVARLPELRARVDRIERKMGKLDGKSRKGNPP
jgi:UDP-3-O-[3-hydroxymyristoyl] glucosamine N-acyltransferase